jgi:hypothetical protein
MTKINDYHIVAVRSSEEPLHQALQREVRKKIQEGWEPLGAPILGDQTMYQAMVNDMWIGPEANV